MTQNRTSRFPQWALAIISAVTLLALTVLVLAIVLGVRAGQQQYELRSRQQVGIALQLAVDLRAEGQLEAALEEYQKVLRLEPGNAAATEGIAALLQIAGGEGSLPADATIPAAVSADGSGADPSNVANQPAASDALLRPQAVLPASDGSTTALNTIPTALPLSTTDIAAPAAGTPADLMAQAQRAIRAGRWQEAVTHLTTLRAQPGGATAEVTNLLFEAYVNLGAEKDNEDNLEGALTWYDRALELRPDAAIVRDERALVSSYLEVLTYYGADWEKAATLLAQLYAVEPQYRDVEVRLSGALAAWAGELMAEGDYCAAAGQLENATSISAASALQLAYDEAQMACDTGVAPLAHSSAISATVTGTADAPLASAVVRAPTGGPNSGRILYSATDVVDGRNLVFAQPADGSASVVLVENAAQPRQRADGVRIAYRNTRSDQGGISAFDPATGVFFRITDYPEDVQPSWDPTGGRVVFASNREGDRRWRIYTAWAEDQGEVVTLSFGEAPQWHPSRDLIVHRGCDDSGNNCGLWLMDGTGSNRSALTTVAGDNRPAWSPDGGSVVFMSDRDGNQDIYRADLATGQVTRLTDNTALDALPTISPDGQWVAFLSNREGGWKLWAVPLAGGEAQLVATLKGDLGDWTGQGLQWVN